MAIVADLTLGNFSIANVDVSAVHNVVLTMVTVGLVGPSGKTLAVFL